MTGPELMPQVLVCLVALGMALAFISADRQSPTSRALAVSFAFIGISIDLNIVTAQQFELPLAVRGWFGLGETIAMIALLQWILLVRRTVPAGSLNVKTGDRLLRFGQGVAVLYAVLAILFPDLRQQQFFGGLQNPRTAGFWMFSAPVLFVALSGFGGILLLLNRRPDRPERIRLLAMTAAIPFLAVSFIVPLEYNSLVMIIGEMIFFIGAVHYHVLQGQRGQFMSRFLSPQVARLVAERGLHSAMQENHLELTVVCCDLRGFTPYAQAQPSSRVLQVLREYYDVVGGVVAEFGATIKDFAGDGILILVGAPLAHPRHAAAGLEMAARIREVGQALTGRWSTADNRLGIGVGVASGLVTVGVIGSSLRLEYTAVGPAVNLASRLCEQAIHGEILVAPRTAELAGGAALESRAPLAVKGFGEDLPRFALPAA